MNKHYLALDYDKVLAILETFVQSPDAKELALALQPETSLKAAERLLGGGTAAAGDAGCAHAAREIRRSLLRRPRQCE